MTGYDWGAIPDWVSVLCNVILIGLAIIGYNGWKAEFRTQKRFEIASRVIEAFSACEEALAYCRARYIQEGVGEQTLTRALKEVDEIPDPLSRDQETAMLVPAATIEKLMSDGVIADFTRLEELRHQTAIILGPRAKDAIEILLNQRTAVFNTAKIYLGSMVVDYHPYRRGENAEIDNFRATITDLGDGDTVRAAIAAARVRLEAITEPVLEIARE